MARQVPLLLRRNEELEVLASEVPLLLKRIEELEAQLGKSSRNSSKPPSSDGPEVEKSGKKRGSGRKRGGQSDQKRRGREPVPVEQVQALIPCKPVECRGCKQALSGTDATPYRHQVFELPEVKAYVFEYQLHSLKCEGCHVVTRAPIPLGVPCGQFGPRLQAVMAVCSGAYRLSKRSIKELMHDFFGVQVSLGTISKLERATSEALRQPYEQVARAIGNQPVVHADETGWYERSKRAWLWTALCPFFAVFLISPSRATLVAKQLIGECFSGFLVSDRWSAYNFVDTAKRQLCWAHIIRDFRAFSAYGQEAKALSEKLESLAAVMFHYWHQVRDGTLSRPDFAALMQPVRTDIEALLTEGKAMSGIGRKCQNFLKFKAALWTFILVEGIEPTNNIAERAVRHAVIWRKACFGTDSPNGSRFVERILTVVTTLRMQNKNVLHYVTNACRDALYGHNTASLLPEHWGNADLKPIE